ncbi:MAG TPA: cytochrome c-type biogenesis protein CcmH [Terracidiphilus sp.]|nr:cytochrome c-type biogenesis protein CcmH [Terracidiphilus sp.]
MNRAKRRNHWIKTAQAIFLAVAVCFSLGASDAGSRFTDLGHRLMCTCGCAQLLGECNHVGCPESDHMRGELMAAVSGKGASGGPSYGSGGTGDPPSGKSGMPPAGMNDHQILDWFAAKYGVTVLAAPPKQGFDLMVWIAPIAVLLAGLLGTVLLVRHWKGTQPVAPDAVSPEISALREKIRRETGDGD